MSGPRDAVETAYFTLLRAREELSALQRYDEYLVAERDRLTRLASEDAALRERVARPLLRALRATDEALTQAVAARLAVLADERRKLPERIEAAAAHVVECEHEHDTLRSGA